MKKNVGLYIFVELLFLLVVSYYYASSYTTPNMKNIRTIGVFCFMLFTFLLYSWHKCGGTFLNGYVAFLTAFFVFNLGQPMLEVFDYVDDYQDLLRLDNVMHLPMYMYFRAAFIGLFFVAVMHIGALYSLSKGKKSSFWNPIISKMNSTGKFKAIRDISLVILIISFPFWFYMTSKMVLFTAAYGYGGALYGEVISNIPGYIRLIGDYYEPALFAYYFSSEYLKKNRNITFVVIFATVIMPPLLIGGRSQAVIGAVIVLIIYFMFHKINRRFILLISIGIYLALNILFAVKKLRNSASVSLNNYIEVLTDKNYNPISGVLSEMGHSMYPLGATMDIVPQEEDYRYGSTYLWAMTSLIPNPGIWEKHPAQLYANLGNWLMKKKSLMFGPGYSIVAEAYINFGYFGFLFFLFWGYYFAKYCKLINRKDAILKPFLFIAAIIFLWFSIKTVRNSFVGMVRAFFYFALLFYYSFYFYYRKYYLKHENC